MRAIVFLFALQVYKKGVIERLQNSHCAAVAGNGCWCFQTAASRKLTSSHHARLTDSENHTPKLEDLPRLA